MEKEQRNSVIVFCTDGTNSRLLVQTLTDHFDVKAVFIEPSEKRSHVFKRRVKKLGFFTAIGQVCFQLGILPFLASKKRIKELLSSVNYDDKPIDERLTQKIDSINAVDIAGLVKAHHANFIFINGTGIIKKSQLEQVNIPIINIHVGITPAFRGVHGGYWAIRNQQPDLFGVTLHLVDSGIDTGKIIDQKVLEYATTDNFKTYPLLQYLGGIALIEQNLEQFKKNQITTKDPITTISELHSHPTFISYLLGRLLHGVK